MNVCRLLIAILALAALAVDAVLLRGHLIGGGIAGCGGGCAAVWSSKWAYVFGFSVTIPALAIHATLVIAAWRNWEKNLVFLTGVVAASAIWFLAIQAFVLREFCPWCTVVHGLGLVLGVLGIAGCKRKQAWLPALAGAVCVGLLAIIQSLSPAPAGYRVEEEKPRLASFDGGRKTYDVSRFPILGNPAAKHVIVEYFDYRCPACRTMAGYLETLVAEHPADVGVLLLPVPLEHGCNPALPAGDAGHPGSCMLARLSLAVWKTKPAAWPACHRRFLAEPAWDEAAARAFAEQQAGPLRDALRDPWIDEILRSNIADWKALSRRATHLPKLMIRDRRILHGLPSGEQDFLRVMKEELGL